ncbi:MAG: NUDIX domain-containing protein [Peptoanaerobacter stomatis]|uniref:NUDIX domain-containing protein n=1 Tax=Peptoanaerobacter stomatis TaxID=796937 RepID=UPI003F9FB573
MKPEIKTIKELATTKFLNMYDVDYVNKIGNSKKWTSVSRVSLKEYENRLLTHNTTTDAVLIAPYHIEKEKLVLVKQYRVPLNHYIYEIPAGLVDNNEDIENCVKRELLEETGLELVEIKKVFKNIYLSPGITDECASLVFCTCKGDISYDHLQEDEDLTIHMYSQDEIDDIIKNEEKLDLKTLFAMQLFKNSGRDFWK